MDKDRNVHAAEVLRRLDEIGAIKLDVLASKAAEIQSVAGVAIDDDDHGICYPFYIRIGPRHDVDLVSVAAQLKQLGFELKRSAVQSAKA
ncbi:MAG: hypothetical protein U0Q18_19085 [Bryobacteraceae bacterium]